MYVERSEHKPHFIAAQSDLIAHEIILLRLVDRAFRLSASLPPLSSVVQQEELAAICTLLHTLTHSPPEDAVILLENLRNGTPSIFADGRVSYGRIKSILQGYAQDHRTSGLLALFQSRIGVTANVGELPIAALDWCPQLHAHLPSPVEIQNGVVLNKHSSRMLVRVRDRIVVKYGRRLDSQEADAMRLTRQRTRVPVPRVHGMYKYEGQDYLFMDYVSGEPLDRVWRTLSENAKVTITSELKSHLREIHSLSAPYVGGAGASVCRDQIFREVDDAGPFPNVTALNDCIHRAYFAVYDYKADADITRIYRRLLNDAHPITFVHGDLVPRNIIVTPDHHIAAILDWELSGFWPISWEWVKAFASAGRDESLDGDWVEWVDRLMQPYDAEFLVDRVFRGVLA